MVKHAVDLRYHTMQVTKSVQTPVTHIHLSNELISAFSVRKIPPCCYRISSQKASSEDASAMIEEAAVKEVKRLAAPSLSTESSTHSAGKLQPLQSSEKISLVSKRSRRIRPPSELSQSMIWKQKGTSEPPRSSGNQFLSEVPSRPITSLFSVIFVTDGIGTKQSSLLNMVFSLSSYESSCPLESNVHVEILCVVIYCYVFGSSVCMQPSTEEPSLSQRPYSHLVCLISIVDAVTSVFR